MYCIIIKKAYQKINHKKILMHIPTFNVWFMMPYFVDMIKNQNHQATAYSILISLYTFSWWKEKKFNSAPAFCYIFFYVCGWKIIKYYEA